LQGASCFRLSASDEGFDFVVWVNKGESTVSRVVLRRGAEVLYDASFTYARCNGLLVPSHVEITAPSTGTKMVQDYAGHTN